MPLFFKNIIYFLVFPVLVLGVAAFFYKKADVYSDFGKHSNYSWRYNFLEIGDMSTKKLLNTKIKYNSFIFGSSRSVNTYACYLQKNIPNAKFFHYAEWTESIGGIYAKLNLLDSLGYELENVVIHIDTDHTFKNNGNYITNHYVFSGDNKYEYYFKHFRKFYANLDANKIKILFGKPYNSSTYTTWQSDLTTNDSHHICTQKVMDEYGISNKSIEEINKIDSLKQSGFLYKRSNVQQFKTNQISISEKLTLGKISKLLKKHHSNYYIIITPLYDQMKFSKADMAFLKSEFPNHIYDFAGINNFTKNEYDFPDREHFQPNVSKAMLDSMLHK
jgi:hypothetical protein